MGGPTILLWARPHIQSGPTITNNQHVQVLRNALVGDTLLMVAPNWCQWVVNHQVKFLRLQQLVCMLLITPWLC